MTDWEYRDYVKTFTPEQTWYAPGLGEGEMTARLSFWNDYQMTIRKELQVYFDQGWQPVSEIGPSAFVVRSYYKSHNNINCLDVVLWFVTFFIYFLIQLLSGTLTYKRIYYEPTEFRVALHREKKEAWVENRVN